MSNSSANKFKVGDVVRWKNAPIPGNAEGVITENFDGIYYNIKIGHHKFCAMPGELIAVSQPTPVTVNDFKIGDKVKWSLDNGDHSWAITRVGLDFCEITSPTVFGNNVIYIAAKDTLTLDTQESLFEFTKEPQKSLFNKCKCDFATIWREGCRCGGK